MWRTRPQDAGGFTLIVSLSIIGYCVATFTVLPEMLVECSPIVQVLGFLLPAWILFAGLSNIILIKVRDSSIRNKLLIQPVLKTPPPSPKTIQENGEHQHHCQDPDFEIKERTKYISQHFVARVS